MNFSVSFVPMDHRLLLIDDDPALLTEYLFPIAHIDMTGPCCTG
jgi:hypothetical protein